MSNQSLNEISGSEIFPKDIVDFLAKSWRTIFFAGFLGVIAAIVNLYLTPNQYVATAYIQLHQINSVGNGDFFSKPIDLEDVGPLIIRLNMTGNNYSEKEFRACGLIDEAAPSDVLLRKASYSQVKNSNSMIKIKVKMTSKDSALQCAQSLFEALKKSQDKILQSRLEAANSKLKLINIQLKETQDLFAQVKKSDILLFNLERISLLNEEALRLKYFINNDANIQTSLVSPISVSDFPISPSKKYNLIAGLFGGLFFGLLFMVVKRVFATYRINEITK